MKSDPKPHSFMNLLIISVCYILLAGSAAFSIYTRIQFNSAHAAGPVSFIMAGWLISPYITLAACTALLLKNITSIYGILIQFTAVAGVSVLSFFTHQTFLTDPLRHGAKAVFMGNPLLLFILGSMVQGLCAFLVIRFFKPRHDPSIDKPERV